LVIFSIYIIDVENLIIIKISLEYRKGIFEYGPEFDFPEEDIATEYYRFLKISQFQNLYFPKGYQASAGNGSFRKYYVLKINNPSEESSSLKKIDSLGNKI
jgi:hypothetical protein